MLSCSFEDGNKASLRHVVTDTLLVRDEEILLVKRSAWLLEGGKWGDVGGLVERDETVAQAAAREVLEETGYTVMDQLLLRICDAPDRRNDDRQNVSFIYVSNVGEKVGEPDNESTEQRWFPLTALPDPSEMAFDHLEFIQLYLKYRKEKFPVPIVS